jgi:hypothetical protein
MIDKGQDGGGITPYFRSIIQKCKHFFHISRFANSATFVFDKKVRKCGSVCQATKKIDPSYDESIFLVQGARFELANS